MSMEKHFEAIKRAIDFIELNLTNPISVDDVCETSTTSSWQFQRLFRLYTSDSIGSYLRSRRLTCASADLLDKPQIRILDVAIEYQFGSHEAFTRSFKKMFGVTPGEVNAFKGEVRLKQKIKLTEKQLLHTLTGIQREPTLIDFPARSFVGCEIQIPSPFSEDTAYIDLVSDLWRAFNPRRKEIVGRKPGTGYGLVLSPEGGMVENIFPYVASVEIETNSQEVLPSKMARFEIGPQRYASFEKRGLADMTRLSMDYIYGFWLPQSGYKRAKGYDLEIFDHRLLLDRPDSISNYCIPIEPI